MKKVHILRSLEGEAVYVVAESTLDAYEYAPPANHVAALNPMSIRKSIRVHLPKKGRIESPMVLREFGDFVAGETACQDCGLFPNGVMHLDDGRCAECWIPNSTVDLPSEPWVTQDERRGPYHFNASLRDIALRVESEIEQGLKKLGGAIESNENNRLIRANELSSRVSFLFAFRREFLQHSQEIHGENTRACDLFREDFRELVVRHAEDFPDIDSKSYPEMLVAIEETIKSYKIANKRNLNLSSELAKRLGMEISDVIKLDQELQKRDQQEAAERKCCTG